MIIALWYDGGSGDPKLTTINGAGPTQMLASAWLLHELLHDAQRALVGKGMEGEMRLGESTIDLAAGDVVMIFRFEGESGPTVEAPAAAPSAWHVAVAAAYLDETARMYIRLQLAPQLAPRPPAPHTGVSRVQRIIRPGQN